MVQWPRRSWSHPVAILRTECWHAGLSSMVFIATLFCLQLIMLRLSCHWLFDLGFLQELRCVIIIPHKS